jgi:hypothetical protein
MFLQLSLEVQYLYTHTQKEKGIQEPRTVKLSFSEIVHYMGQLYYFLENHSPTIVATSLMKYKITIYRCLIL